MILLRKNQACVDFSQRFSQRYPKALSYSAASGLRDQPDRLFLERRCFLPRLLLDAFFLSRLLLEAFIFPRLLLDAFFSPRLLLDAFIFPRLLLDAVPPRPLPKPPGRPQALLYAHVQLLQPFFPLGVGAPRHRCL